MSGQVARLVGLEREACAVDDARANAARNQIGHATFVAASAEAGLQALLEGLSAAEREHLVAVVDPPRAVYDLGLKPQTSRRTPTLLRTRSGPVSRGQGLHPAVVKALRGCLALRRLVFVSCHAPGFVQNAVGLCRPASAGFAGPPFVPRRALPVDLFPGTEHCELVVLLERQGVEPAAEPEGGGEPLEGQTAKRARVS